MAFRNTYGMVHQYGRCDSETIQYLMSIPYFPRDLHDTILQQAIKWKNKELMEYMIARSSNFEIQAQIGTALRIFDMDIVRLLLDNYVGVDWHIVILSSTIRPIHIKMIMRLPEFKYNEQLIEVFGKPKYRSVFHHLISAIPRRVIGSVCGIRQRLHA